MKRIKQVSYIAIATVLVAAPFVASAQFSLPADGTGGLSNTSIFDLLGTVLNWLLGIIGVLAVLAFVISGILYLTSAGNEEQVETAKKIMTSAIIGLVVALLGLVIVNAVAGLTGAGGESNLF